MYLNPQFTFFSDSFVSSIHWMYSFKKHDNWQRCSSLGEGNSPLTSEIACSSLSMVGTTQKFLPAFHVNMAMLLSFSHLGNAFIYKRDHFSAYFLVFCHWQYCPLLNNGPRARDAGNVVEKDGDISTLTESLSSLSVLQVKTVLHD